MRLLMGTAKVDITPSKPVPLAGYSHRKGNMEGVIRNLYLRANVFQQTDRSGRIIRLLLAAADIIWWGSERMDNIRRQLGDRFGFDPAHVVLSASHSHGSPQTSDMFSAALGLPDDDYIRQLEQALYEAAERAIADLEPVVVEAGKGECRIGINRRKLVNGVVEMAPNPEGLFDPEVSVFRFATRTGRTKAVFVHYACHPTTTGINYAHPDYPGAAAERLERKLDGANVVFLQGCCGNIRPALHRDGKFYSGTEQDVERLGGELADEVMRVLELPMRPLQACELGGRRAVASLPFESVPTEQTLRAAVEEGGHTAEWARKLLERPELIRTHAPLEMTRLDIADGLSLLAMSGEIVLEYGMFVKRETGGNVLPLGYCNGMVGYVPTSAQLAEGGYEADRSGIYFALPSKFDPFVERIMMEKISDLIRK